MVKIITCEISMTDKEYDKIKGKHRDIDAIITNIEDGMEKKLKIKKGIGFVKVTEISGVYRYYW